MIRVSARVTGADELDRAFMARSRRASGAIQLALEEGATIVQAEAQRLVSDGPKTGRIYRKYNPRRDHQASAPGQAPATDLGHLISNIVIDRADVVRGRIVIASLAKYSAPLEFGSSRIAPRPFMRPALNSSRLAVKVAVIRALNRQGF